MEFLKELKTNFENFVLISGKTCSDWTKKLHVLWETRKLKAKKVVKMRETMRINCRNNDTFAAKE